MININTRITSLEIAHEWLEKFQPTNFTNGILEVSTSCNRCAGTGNTGIYWVDGGVCFKCNGHGNRQTVTYTPITWAQKCKAEQLKVMRAQAKAQAEHEEYLERQRKYNESTGVGRVTNAEARDIKEKQWAKEKAEAKQAPVGRHTISATVLKVEVKETQYGTREVMTLKSKDGFLVWGSVPSSINPSRGDTVIFTANFTQSEDDAKFAFYKRPTKACLVVNKTR